MLINLIWKVIRLFSLIIRGKNGKAGFKRILIMRYGFLGDILQTTPVLRYIQENFPEAVIDYWVSKKAAVAITNNPRVNKIIDADRFGTLQLKKPLSILKCGLSLRKGRYTMAVCLNASPLDGFLAWLGNIPFRIGLINNLQKSVFLHKAIIVPENSREPRQKSYYAVLNLIGNSALIPDDYPIELYWSNSDEEKIDILVKAIKGELIALFPGGGENIQYRPWANRKWPVERWVELAQKTLSRFPAARLALLGTTSESAIADSIIKAVPRERVINCVNQTSFVQLGPLLKRCRMLISNDSSAVFVAAAVGCPAIVIYGPEWPERARPLVKNWHPIFVDIDCREQCASSVKPSFCDNKCIKNISADEVFKKACEMMTPRS